MRIILSLERIDIVNFIVWCPNIILYYGAHSIILYYGALKYIISVSDTMLYIFSISFLNHTDCLINSRHNDYAKQY